MRPKVGNWELRSSSYLYPLLRPDSAIEVQKVELYARQNATNHRTGKYDLIGDSAAVLRRSAPFFLAIVTKNRPADLLNRHVLFVTICQWYG